MLSQSNIDKLCLTGLYECSPVLSWLPSYRRDDPYHCINWNFKVKHYGDQYYMVDTYWSSDAFRVELTDENFDTFTLLFDFLHVQQVNPYDFYDYPEQDRWHVALDSAGHNIRKYYFVRSNAQRDDQLIVERLQGEICSLRQQIQTRQRELEMTEKQLSEILIRINGGA